jgi:hypothetical protein
MTHSDAELDRALARWEYEGGLIGVLADRSSELTPGSAEVPPSRNTGSNQ